MPNGYTKIYREKKARLESIEVAVLVNDIQQLNAQKNDLEKSLFDLETNSAMQETTIQVHENTNFENKARLREYDKIINSTQEKLMQTVNEISILETRKIEIDEKRKYDDFGVLMRSNSQSRALEEAFLESNGISLIPS